MNIVGLSRGRELKLKYTYGDYLDHASASHEVVSWNINPWFWRTTALRRPLTRSWVEMTLTQNRPLRLQGRPLTRSWVEITVTQMDTSIGSNRPLCEAESWNEIYAVEDINAADVSFLEKLWVEITILSLMRSLTSSASMWGRELKYIIDMKILCMEKSASLWGCELK